MPALSFKAQFADAVERGEKRQTIRARRKRPFMVSDRLYLYTGMRTKACRKLGESTCTEVLPIEICIRREHQCVYGWVTVGGNLLSEYQILQLAQADGFSSAAEFFKFFCEDAERFRGQLVKWGDLIS